MHTFSAIPKEQLKFFGKRLQERRKKVGIKSQEDFADKLDVNLKTIRNWEQGRNAPELNTLINICNMLDCSPDFLLGYIDETSHDMRYISQETGLTETSIRNIQEMWLKTLTKDERTLALWNKSEEVPELQYRKNAVQSVAELHKYWKEHGQLISGYEEDPDHYLSELVKEKKEKSRTLSALNVLLSSPTGKAILENIYAFLHFEYEPSDEEKGKTKEFNAKHGTSYKSVIKGKNGYVDSEYLNNSFLVSIQNNCAKLKEEITKKDSP